MGGGRRGGEGEGGGEETHIKTGETAASQVVKLHSADSERG